MTSTPPDGERDYISEMHALIEEKLPVGDWRSAGIAHDIVDYCEQHDPELLTGFLWARRHNVLRDLITRRCDQDRGRLRAQARIAVHNATARAAIASHDPDAMPSAAPRYREVFNRCFTVSDEHLRRPIGQMTADDSLYVANGYERTARQAERDQAFWRRMAKELRNHNAPTIADLYTEQQWLRLYQAVTGHEQPDVL